MSGGGVLTPSQLEFWRTWGYLQLPGLVREELPWIVREFEAVVPGGENDMQTSPERSGKVDMPPYDGTRTSTIVPTIDHSERLCTLLDNPKILAVAGALLGPDFSYASGDGHYYVGDTSCAAAAPKSSRRAACQFAVPRYYHSLRTQ
eukprot:SAG22_NODE_4069_length_1397_cov_6.004622_1_plen_147_part_00